MVAQSSQVASGQVVRHRLLLDDALLHQLCRSVPTVRLLANALTARLALAPLTALVCHQVPAVP